MGRKQDHPVGVLADRAVLRHGERKLWRLTGETDLPADRAAIGDLDFGVPSAR